MRRQDGSRGEKYVGTVRLVEADSAVIEWPDGRRERIPLPTPSGIAVIPAGSVQYRALRDFQELEKEFAKAPVPVLVALLEEMGEEVAIKQLRDETRRLGLAGELDSTWWSRTRKRLLEHPRVTESRPQGSLKIIEDPFQKERSLPAREALEALATPATKRPRGLELALREAVQAGQSELTAYERVAARTLKTTLRSWPAVMNAYDPRGVSQKVLAMAVEFFADVTKGLRRANNPTTEPSPKLGKLGAPPAVAVTPLLVGLVTTPEESGAADQATKLPRGLAAQACVMAVMERFDTEGRTVGGDHLLRRGAVLLACALEESPLVPAERREAFAEELLARTLGLLLRSTGQYLPSDPEWQWVDLVLSAVPEHTLRRGIAARCAEDLAAALEALADRPDGGRERATLVLASLAGAPDEAENPESPAASAAGSGKLAHATSEESGSASASKASPEEQKTQEPKNEPVTTPVPAEADAPAEEPEAVGDGDVTVDVAPAPEVASEEPKRREQQPEPETTAAPAEANPSAHAPGGVVETPAGIAGAPFPEAALPSEERSRLEAALSRERAVAHALRSERDQLKRDLAASERRYERADEEFAELRTRLEAVTAELAAATRRQEALTLQAQRREQELRQARQAGRAASQAQLRQARIDGLRVLATVLAEVADQAAHAADESDPSRALYRRVLTQAATAGLVDIGAIGEETAFDPSHHQAPTGQAERVVVERPGFAWRAGGSQEEVVLLPALVRRAER